MAPPRTRPRRLLCGLGAALLLAAVLAQPASANVISPPPAHSPNAKDITTLYWIGLIAAAVIVLAVNAALIFAVVRYRARRGSEPRRVSGGRLIQLRAGGALAAFIAVVFVLSVIYTEKARTVPPSGPNGLAASANSSPLMITATGQQWLWRYQYPNGTFSYYQLIVPVDTTVRLVLSATDVVHSWYVPALGGKFDAVPGHSNETTFRADRLGNYYGGSAQFSGAAYATMRTEVSVVTATVYKRFIKHQKAEIQAAQTRVERLISRNGGAPPGEPNPNATAVSAGKR